MGQIGEYVHYYGTNYAKYGIARTGQGVNTGFRFDQVQSNIRDRAATAMNLGPSKEELNEIKTQLNNILDPTVQDDKVEQAREAINQKMIEQFQQNVGTLSYTSGGVYDSARAVIDEERQELLDKRNAVLSQIKISGDKMYAETIASRLRGIANVMGTIKSVDSRHHVMDILKEITKEFKQMCNITDSSLSIFKTSLAGLKIPMLSIDDQLTNLITSVNELLAIVRGTSVTAQSGAFGEYLAAAVNYLIDGNGISNIGDALKEVQGQQTHKVEISSDFFIDSFDTSALNWQTVDENGHLVEISHHGNFKDPQGKLDVTIHLESGKDAKVSMKNYRLGANFAIKLVSGTSLLYLLQDEDSDFVNHYLNLAASHQGNWRTENMTTQLQAARMTVQLLIIWKAMTGLTYNNVSASDNSTPLDADTLIINDTGASGADSIHVYSMGDIMKKLINLTNTANDLSALNSYIEVSSSGGDLNTIRFPNEFAGTVEERINTLLTSVHAQKVSVALKPAFIQNFNMMH